MIFISHRRVDGEEIAAKLCDRLEIQARDNNIFRDIICVEVGEDAQDIIDKALSKSDIMIFLHTEKSAESKWIEKELRYALLKNIPILWVRIDNANIDNLKIKPTDKPHIECLNLDFEDQNELVKLVDEILQKSFDLAMIDLFGVYSELDMFINKCNNNNIKLLEEDKKNLIYSFSLPRKGYTYPQRDIKHYVQYFGRKCDDNDFEQIKKFLNIRDESTLNLFDSVILASNKLQIRKVSDRIVEENYEDFNKAFSEYIDNNSLEYDIEIILSGAFTECNLIYQQCLQDAVSIFAKEILKNGFNLTFGAHPTFQNLIFEIGKEYRPKDYKKAINMYISKFFKSKYDIGDLKENATIIECDKIDNDLEKSLTEMRTKMISSRKTIKALICLGGVIRTQDIKTGINEEIKIARANNIPVFVIGTVGGRSSEIASEYYLNKNWSKLNDENNEFNENMTFSFNYRDLANQIIKTIKDKK